MVVGGVRIAICVKDAKATKNKNRKRHVIQDQ